MGDKRQETLSKYVGDMKAVIDHVERAMDRQKDEFKDHPDVTRLVSGIVADLRDQANTLEARAKALGGSPTKPVKEAAAGAFGVLAGLYDKVRTEGAVKAVRDDHVALNWCYVSYMTLHTTSEALGDRETATIAERGMKRCAGFVMDVVRQIPPLVLRELSDGDLGTMDQTAPQRTDAAIDEAWTSTGSRTVEEERIRRAERARQS